MVQSLLGAPGVAQLNMYMLFVRLYCWSYGLSLYTGVKSDWCSSVRRLLLHPCMIATGLGLLVMVTEWPVPAVLTGTAEYFSGCLMALSMLLIGAVLSHPLEGVSSAGCMGVRAAAAGRSARAVLLVCLVPGALCGDGYLHTLVWYARSQPYGCAGRPIPGR